MYVQYKVPPSSRVPVVMVHGADLSGKSYETTPDGRLGWEEYFVRKGHAVYLPDQVSRARSGFDPTIDRAKRRYSLRGFGGFAGPELALLREADDPRRIVAFDTHGSFGRNAGLAHDFARFVPNFGLRICLETNRPADPAC
jgi:hypothetical protein